MKKWYNQKTFVISTSNGDYVFECHTTDTRMGFCHTAHCVNTGTNTKCSYYNRTWESYDYQSVLKDAFRKLGKKLESECLEWDKKKTNKDHEECEAFVNRFKKAYDGLTDGQKERLAESDVMITTKEQADTALVGIEMMSALNKLLG